MLPVPGELRSWISPPSRPAQFAADRQPETGAAVFAAGAGVGLLERLENDFLFLERDADAGVGDFEGHHTLRLAEHGMTHGPAAGHRADLELDAALVGELEGVGKQILEHLLHALGIGDQAAAERGIELDVERQLLVVRLVTERTADRVEQVGEEYLLGFHGDRAGFDLGQIENVADQIEQIGSGAVDGAGEFGLLAGEVAVRIVGELLAEDQDAS